MSSAARPPSSAARRRKPSSRRLAQKRLEPSSDALLPFRSFADVMSGFPGTSLDPRLRPDF